MAFWHSKEKKLAILIADLIGETGVKVYDHPETHSLEIHLKGEVFNDAKNVIDRVRAINENDYSANERFGQQNEKLIVIKNTNGTYDKLYPELVKQLERHDKEFTKPELAHKVAPKAAEPQAVESFTDFRNLGSLEFGHDSQGALIVKIKTNQGVLTPGERTYLAGIGENPVRTDEGLSFKVKKGLEAGIMETLRNEGIETINAPKVIAVKAAPAAVKTPEWIEGLKAIREADDKKDEKSKHSFTVVHIAADPAKKKKAEVVLLTKDAATLEKVGKILDKAHVNHITDNISEAMKQSIRKTLGGLTEINDKMGQITLDDPKQAQLLAEAFPAQRKLSDSLTK